MVLSLGNNAATFRHNTIITNLNLLLMADSGSTAFCHQINNDPEVELIFRLGGCGRI